MHDVVVLLYGVVLGACAFGFWGFYLLGDARNQIARDRARYDDDRAFWRWVIHEHAKETVGYDIFAAYERGEIAHKTMLELVGTKVFPFLTKHEEHEP